MKKHLKKEETYSVVLLGGPHHNSTFHGLTGEFTVPNYVQKEEWDARGYVVFRFEEGANLE